MRTFAASPPPSRLFEPLTLIPELVLPNRIVMAPLTRCMAEKDLVPTSEMATYYAKRAEAGLIVTEATLIRADGQGYPRTPGIWNARQVEGWKRVTDAVHERGGRMFCQLWHCGRAAHSAYHKQVTLAPSAAALSGPLPRRRRLSYEKPREMSRDDIDGMLDSYARATEHAFDAGFDGVEIHGANGYLVDQFLHFASNLRQDEYGGSPERMVRFALEVLRVVSEVASPERTGIRLSPWAHINMDQSPEDRTVFELLFQHLSQQPLAYVHTGLFDDFTSVPDFSGRISDFVRQHYSGRLVVAGGYDRQRAEDAVLRNRADLVAFGRSFIANPDLVAKLRNGEALQPYDEAMLRTLT